MVKNRIRKKGGGRKPSIEIIENIDEVFLKIIDDYFAGDPMDEKIRWTNLSQKQIAERMQQQGIGISVTVVKKLLKKHYNVNLSETNAIASLYLSSSK